MNNRYFIVWSMLLLLLVACKREKDHLIPYTTFEVVVEENGIVRVTPSGGEGTQVWDFGDGTAAVQGISGAPVWHCYAKNGNYSVRLIVQSDLGGRTEFSATAPITKVPQRGFISGIQVTGINDYTADPDNSGTDIVFNIKKYTESTTDTLYRSVVDTNVHASELPINIGLHDRVEFPLSGFLVSISMEDDNRGTLYPNDILCYTAWYDGSMRPTQGVSWLTANNKPEYYPEVISRTQFGNTMKVSFEWE